MLLPYVNVIIMLFKYKNLLNWMKDLKVSNAIQMKYTYSEALVKY